MTDKQSLPAHDASMEDGAKPDARAAAIEIAKFLQPGKLYTAEQMAEGIKAAGRAIAAKEG